MSNSPFQKIVQELFKATRNADKSIESLKKISRKIDDKYHPRTEFERWRDSVDGQAWKQNQYIIQKNCCAICKKSIDLKGSHIDHKRPISLHPELALNLKNLQITCAECNLAKGNKMNEGNEENSFQITQNE